MLRAIDEFGKYVAIAGFRNVKIKDIGMFLQEIRREEKGNVEIQFFDARFLATEQHLYFAALNALTAFKNKENISRSLAVETMLFASFQPQIRKATELVGIKPSSSEIAVLAIADEKEKARASLAMIQRNINALRDDSVLGISEEKAVAIERAFGISNAELDIAMNKTSLEEALLNLIIEHMALLTTQR